MYKVYKTPQAPFPRIDKLHVLVVVHNLYKLFYKKRGHFKMSNYDDINICQQFARIIGGQEGFAGGKCVATINRDEIQATILGKTFLE
ncbi:hypothetical protein GCM10020331_012700 [Ectobacillus funiculus]